MTSCFGHNSRVLRFERGPWEEGLANGEVVLLDDISDELAEFGRSLEDSAEEEQLGSAP